MKRLGLLCIAAATLLNAPGVSGQSVDTREIEIDLPALPLARALNAFADRANLTIMISIKDAGDLRSPPLKGRFTPKAALDRLLARSNLTYTLVGERTFEIHASKSPSSAKIASGTPKKSP